MFLSASHRLETFAYRSQFDRIFFLFVGRFYWKTQIFDLFPFNEHHFGIDFEALSLTNLKTKKKKKNRHTITFSLIREK